MTYPLIYAKNKLILEPNNVDHFNEQVRAEWNITHQPVEQVMKKRPSIWADLLMFNFVVASILVAGTFWPYGRPWYWLTFAAAALIMVALIGLDYKRAVSNQENLRKKHEKLAKIKSEFGEWRNKKMSGE